MEFDPFDILKTSGVPYLEFAHLVLAWWSCSAEIRANDCQHDKADEHANRRVLPFGESLCGEKVVAAKGLTIMLRTLTPHVSHFSVALGSAAPHLTHGFMSGSSPTERPG